MKRVSNHQLKALLQNLESAAGADHPLSAMFRGMIKDALLDLRDTRQERARLGWYVSNMERCVRSAIKISEERLYPAIRSQDHRDADNVFMYLLSDLKDADNQHPPESYTQEAIAPLTGKEK